MLDQVDGIFFEASGTKTFSSPLERAAFHDRWLGRYLAHDAQHAFLAFAGANDEVAGYLVGSLDDPAQSPRFDDLAYFRKLAAFTARYPANLHVNLAPEWRGRGLGQLLVDAFCRHAARAGTRGVHVFTGRGMRNVRFYQAAGFREVAATEWNGREIVMLARDLT
ncbi:MAG: GNAT family N-acetyltransferase [Hyphomicrobium sp.]|nr:GNAT family N-acetyltransferase [Hyphomicrobium sp.]